MPKRTYLIFILLVFILMSCQKAGSGAVTAVEQYYLAVVQEDPNLLSSIVCSDFEEEARLELDSFQGVKIELTDFGCSESDRNGTETLVKCTGKIEASYGNEVMDFPLDSRVHKVINQAGDWFVCGY
jgi:hypothetical protein